MAKRLKPTFIDVSDIEGDTESVFRKLISLAGPGKMLASYRFGRLVNQWLADQPGPNGDGLWPKCRNRLAEMGLTRWYGDGGNYCIRYTPNRLLDVGLMGGGRARVFDLGRWFPGLTLDEALTRYGADDLPDLGSKLWEATARLDVIPSSGYWCGPGASATALMRRREVACHNPIPSENPEGFESLFRHAYYGGRIQAVQVGQFGPAIRYDLRSAYASAMSDLPSLQGTWVPFRSADGIGDHCLIRVRWSTPDDYNLTPFPWRGINGHISYPREGHGWYWGSLVKAAMAGPWELEIIEGWRFVTDNPECRPFGYLNELHQRRLATSDRLEHSILKGVLVSSYGKLMQQGGYRRSGLQSMAWAGMTTARIHARLLSAAVQAPDRVTSFLTDGLFVIGKGDLNLPIGGEMGEWERESVDGLWVFQPAFYVTEHRHGPEEVSYDLHAAGIRDDCMLARRAVGAWMVSGLFGKVRFSSQAYCGMALARQRGWECWNTTIDVDREVRLHPVHGFPGAAGAASWRWEAWNPGTDFGTLSAPYAPKGEGMIDGRWEEVEEIRGLEECL